MRLWITAGAAAAWLSRVGDVLADPASLMALQERLQRHGAELGAQLPELLLRAPDAEQAVRQWLADKDLSHWFPQAEGGTALQGWQFETAAWNRARGAVPLDPFAIGRAHLDGGLDALLVEGMPEAILIEGLEAAMLAAGLSLGLWLLARQHRGTQGNAGQRDQLLREGLQATGLGALSGLGLSLVLSTALALVPGGQLWLSGLGLWSLVRALPAPSLNPFDLRDCARSRAIGRR